MQIDVDPEQQFHVVIDGAAQALSLDELAELYQADSIGDETLIWQDGFTDWMRLDTLLAALGEQDQEQEATPSVPEPAADPNKYRVLFPPDEVKSMPVEALADAHRLGVVDDDTLVQAPGSTEWVPLAVIIAGFVLSAPRSVAPSQRSTQPAASQPAPVQHAPYPQAPTQQTAQPQAPIQQTLEQSVRQTIPLYVANPTQHAPAPQAPAPQAPAPQAPYQQVDQQSALTSPSSAPSAPNTLAPTAANVGAGQWSIPPSAGVPSGLDDSDFPAFQSSRSLWFKRSLIGVGALVVVFGIYQATNDQAGEGAAQPASAAAQVVPAVPSPEAKAEPSDWEKEQALLEAARLRDEALAKAAKSDGANAFGASLAGEPTAKKRPASSAVKNKSPLKAKKSPASANTDTRQYDPMNGAL